MISLILTFEEGAAGQIILSYSLDQTHGTPAELHAAQDLSNERIISLLNTDNMISLASNTGFTPTLTNLKTQAKKSRILPNTNQTKQKEPNT